MACISECVAPAEPDTQWMTSLDVSVSLAVHLELLTRRAEDAARAGDWASVQVLVKQALAAAIMTTKRLRKTARRRTGRQAH